CAQTVNHDGDVKILVKRT
ncbi:unnamed protein product, partial [Callosobruchus maculatus]